MKIDGIIEEVVTNTKQMPLVKSSNKVVKKRPETVFNQNPENPDIFGKKIHVGVNDILRVQSKLQQQSMKLFINVKSMELMRLFYPQLSLLVELMLKF